MSKEPDLSDKERERLRDALKALVEKLGTQAKAAAVLGVTQQAVGIALKEGRIGRKLGEAIEAASSGKLVARDVLDPAEVHIVRDSAEMHYARAPVLRSVFDAYPWPSGTPTDAVAAIWTALSAEEFAHRGAYIPPAHWTNRIAEELAARKGKRIEHVMTDDPVEERKRARKRG